MGEAVVVENLVVRYGDLTAVAGVSFTARKGEVLALLGPNGAGKTSTIEVCEGFRSPTKGRVRVLDLDPVKNKDHVVGRVGIMLQNGGIYPGIRSIEMLELLADLYDDPLDPGDLLEWVGLADRSHATWRTLSGGEQQRLSLAMALVGQPEVLFLDEPTAGVDVRGRQVIRDLIRQVVGWDACVVLCTHDLAEAERVADQVVIVDKGKVVTSGTLDELRADANRIMFSAPPGIDVLVLGNHLGVAVVQEVPGEYQLTTNGDPTMVARLTQWLADNEYPLGDLRAGRQRLEDVFLSLTGADEEPSTTSPRRGRRRGRRDGGT